MGERIALYGGSFNPPHVGHALGIAWVLSATPVDAVWLIPCWAHAFDKPLAPFEHRRAMCAALAAPFAPDRVAVSDVEARIGGTSRTIDTVTRLRDEHPEHRFDLVVGADIFAERHQWKRFDALERLCAFWVLGRAGYPGPPGRKTSPPLPDVSSTEVRRRLRAGEDAGALVPRAVGDYIARHRLVFD